MMNIGCDIEAVDTFRKKWKNGEMKFFERIFSKDEIEYCMKFKDPFMHFAARFSAKEAIIKAANEFCTLVISDIQILKNKNNAPVVKVWKKRKSTVNFFNKYQINVSLSHTSDMAMACALIQKKP
jgi:holo-[acyl-carrier protein] synthase